MSRRTCLCELLLVALLSGCPGAEPASFTLKVRPETIDDTIPGQRCVLLVTIEEDIPGASEEAVAITGTGVGATASVDHGTIREGQIAEVEVTMLPPQSAPAGGDDGWPCSATIHAERGGVSRQIEVPILLTSDEPDELGPAAAEMRDRFIPWLAENRPDLGIDAGTLWQGTIVKPHWLVVSHYLFFSAEWELHVAWHVMIPPHDWARIDLRRRFDEILPSLAFEIPSVSAPPPAVVNEIEPEGILWR